jgi:hypothetical protein
VIAPSPRAQHLEVKIKGLSDMTLKFHVAAGVACKRNLTAKSHKLPANRSKFAAMSSIIVTAVR